MMVKYCGNCGKKIDENVNFCSDCGAVVNKNVNDGDKFLWGVLGFFVPLMGFILFLVWKNEKPKCAKALGLGALISLLLKIIFVILVLIFIFIPFAGDVISEEIFDDWGEYKYDYDYKFE